MMSEAEKAYFYSRNFTLKGQIYFPEILVPKPNDKGVMKYTTLFAWDANDATQAAQVQAIGEFLAGAKQQFYPTIPEQHFGKPLKRWDTYVRQDGKPNHDFLTGKYWMNASATERVKPTVVDQWKQEVIDPAQVYSGRNALLNFSFYGYDANGNKGIAVNISAVMLLEGGERMLGGGVNLDDAFGGFQADMGAAPVQNVAQAMPAQAQQQYAPAQAMPAQQPMQQQYQAPVQQPVQPHQPLQNPNAGVAAQPEQPWNPGQPNTNPFPT